MCKKTEGAVFPLVVETMEDGMAWMTGRSLMREVSDQRVGELVEELALGACMEMKMGRNSAPTHL